MECIKVIDFDSEKSELNPGFDFEIIYENGKTYVIRKTHNLPKTVGESEEILGINYYDCTFI